MGKIKILGRLVVVFLPEWLVARLYPVRPTYREAMIDPKAYVVGRLIEAMRPTGEIPNVEEGRKRLRDVAAKFDTRVTISRVEDLSIEGENGPLEARLFSDSHEDQRPAMVYFHGGGFVQGDIESHHHTCTKLAKWSGYTVISVNYRLAPEHPFPAAPEDCIAAFQSIIERADALGIDPAKTGVGGDSAGGCLAAVTAQQLAAKGGARAAFQVLIYPVVDGNLETKSVADMPDDAILSDDVLAYFLKSYAGDWTDKNDPLFSPFFGKEPSALPDTYILTGGFDPLRDDGKLYAEKLEAAGVAVSHTHFSGQIHGFISLTKVIPQGMEALKGIADWLKSRI